jgi:hypothetical protein
LRARAHACAEFAQTSTLSSESKARPFWPGFFLFWPREGYFGMHANAALSNAAELINLRWIAKPGIGPAA